MHNLRANTDRLVVTRRGTFPRQWFLVVLAKETKHTYHWAHPELLDQRPLPELCQILANHYGTKKLASELVSHGNIIKLGESVSQCEFSGHTPYKLGDRPGWDLWARCIHWKKGGWVSEHHGPCKRAERVIVRRTEQLSLGI